MVPVNDGFRAAVALRYPVAPRLEDWVLPEGTVPESAVHDAAAQRLRLVLEAWAARRREVSPEGPAVQIARNLAVRWLEGAPQVGIDPDVCVLCPPPPEGPLVESLCLWRPGHHPPRISFEVVSRNHPHKDYVALHERYAAMGTGELVVFDPLLAGPRALGGPVALQLWRRDDSGALERVHFGSGPAYSEVLDAWLLPREHHLDLASDRDGERRWRTEEEHQRAEKERERAEKERERAEKERERAEKERERAEKERERAARLELERRLTELERRPR